MSTNVNYVGKVPPKMCVALVYKVVPEFAGSTGGPVTPVPIGAGLKSGSVGIAYSETITAQGGSGTGYTYAVSGGSLPAGLSLNSSTGVISGTPTTLAVYSFTIKVTDSLLNTGTQSFTINVLASPVTLVGQVLQNAVVGTAYSETIMASGGSGGYTYAVTSGSLPTGLSLSSGGVISGTPSGSPGTSTFTITATDSSGNTGSQSFSIIVAAASSGGGGAWTFLN